MTVAGGRRLIDHIYRMPAIEQKLEKSRLSAEDWALAALDVIAESGLAAVAVEPLARRLGVTKGSFYWHFPSREALLVAALERWERTEQETVFGQMEAVSDPRVRLRELFELVAREPKSHIIYSELLKALDHPVVKPVLSRVSVRRMDYLAASFRQAGLPRQDAQNRARLAYAAYVGFLQLALQLGQPRLHRDELDAYVRHVATTLIPD
jgi:AcrR family transcriptional regulator